MWHLAVLWPIITCIDQTYCSLSHKYHWQSFYNHFSLGLCTKVVQKLYRSSPSCCTEVVQADSACSSCTIPKLDCTEVIQPHPEVVMYQTGPNPCIITRNHSIFGDRAFAAAGLGLWNSLPPHLRDADLLYSRFRQSLDMFLWTVGPMCNLTI